MTDIKKLGQMETEDVLATTMESIVAGLMGIASSERKELILAVGHIFQRARAYGFLEALTREWNEFQAKGKVDPDYTKSEQHRACLQELLDFLDKDSPDQIRFDAIKSIFLSAATEHLSSRDSFLPQQYMRTCRSLSSGEVVVLKTIYETVQQDKWNRKENSSVAWLRAVAARSGLQHVELVEVHERCLIEKHLLTPRLHPDQSGIQLNDHWRLTDFGWALCRFIVFEQ